MMDFEEWYKGWEDVQQDGRLSYDIRQGAEEAWDYQQQRVDLLEKKIATMLDDIRGACGCTSGEDIRNHLSEYLEDE